MGQYQEDKLNLKGLKLELVQRNSQISCPFMVFPAATASFGTIRRWVR